MESKLPKNWVECTLDELALVQSGGTPSRGNKAYWNGNIPWIKISDIKDLYVDQATEYITEEGLVNSAARLFPKGTILFTIFATIGRIGVLNIDATTNQAIAGITPTNLINHKYLTYSLIDLSNSLQEQGKGVAQKNINQAILKSTLIPLPPLAEQNRIVVKLDALFAQLETIKASMAKVPLLLKDFRQQVLTQAVTGKLTEEWRKGKELEEWREEELQTVAKIVDPHPSHRTPPEYENGVPYISIGDINDDKSIDFLNSRKVNPDVLKDHIKRYKLKKGDFIFGKIGTIGKPIRIPSNQNYCLSANVILIQPNEDKVNPSYVYFYLDSPYLLKKVLEKSVATSQAAFGIKKMRVEKIELPSLSEQQEIVSRVESLFAKANDIEKQYETLKAKIDSLPQAILHKAFKGELTEQLDTDGDARELLREIEGLKAAMGKKRKSNTTKSVAKTVKSYVEKDEVLGMVAEK